MKVVAAFTVLLALCSVALGRNVPPNFRDEKLLDSFFRSLASDEQIEIQDQEKNDQDTLPEQDDFIGEEQGKVLDEMNPKAIIKMPGSNSLIAMKQARLQSDSSNDTQPPDGDNMMAKAQSIQLFQYIPGHLIHITASPNYLWGVNSGHYIFRCNRPCTGHWRCVGGYLQQVDASDEELWGVNRHGHIFKRPVDGSGGWRHIGGNLKHVSASGNGYIWGVNRGDYIYNCKKPCTGAWRHIGGRLSQIDAGQSYVYGVNSGGAIFRMPVDASAGWHHIPGPPGSRIISITGSGSDAVYVTGTRSEIYRCKKPCIGEWEAMAGHLKQIDATFDQYVGVSQHGQIFKHVTTF